MARQRKDAEPRWVIDLHGMRYVLSSESCERKSTLIDAIQRREMLVLRSVSDELRDMYPNIYDMFRNIDRKKYMHTSVKAATTVAMLVEDYGTSFIGSVPDIAHFEAVATALDAGLVLVSYGKALRQCTGIVKKCGLADDSIVCASQVPIS